MNGLYYNDQYYIDSRFNIYKNQDLNLFSIIYI